MARKYACDLCRMDVALENQLIPIKFGEELVAEVCYKCSATLKKGLKEQVVAIAASPMETPPENKTAPETPAAQQPQAAQPAAGVQP